MGTPIPLLDFDEAVARICARDGRYDPEAYAFVRDALEVAGTVFRKPREGAGRHVTGRELLEGIRAHALAEFGPMAARVLATWNVKRTEDFGALVFNLVEAGVLGRTDEDRIEDFADGYDFDAAFRAPFRPARRRGRARPSPPRAGSAQRRVHEP